MWTYKTKILFICYKLVASWLPISQRSSFSKKWRTFFAKRIIKQCGENVIIERGAVFTPDLTGFKTILGVRVQNATYLCLKRQFQHWLVYCFEFWIQSTTLLTVRCSVHPPQANSTRKAAVCLHTFISICADAKRPNGWLVWKLCRWFRFLI